MTSTVLVGHACRICKFATLREAERFRGLPRVTSDSRPWPAGGRIAVCERCSAVQKLVEPNWLEDVNRIYKSYDIYHQAGGEEQPIFTVEASPPVPRSLALMQYLDRRVPLRETALVLDFGCGSGAALTTYSTLHPKWMLYGAELTTQNLARLQRIPGFIKLFTCLPTEIPLQFDLISAFHALEHVLDPVAALQGLTDRLADGGLLFVEVPDVQKNPYDLVIADHLLHFTLDVLRFTAQRAGCAVLELTDSFLPKELTLLARSAGVEERRTKGRNWNPDQSIGLLDAQIAWLADQVTSADTLARNSSGFGLFGTSISATWLAGQLGNYVSFFVDEDKARIGRRHMGKPILAPATADGDVYVPLIPSVAASVVQRLSRPGLRFHRPPPIGERESNQQMVR